MESNFVEMVNRIGMSHFLPKSNPSYRELTKKIAMLRIDGKVKQLWVMK